MADNFPPEGGEGDVDYSGLIIGLVLIPVFFVLAHFEGDDMGLGISIALGTSMAAARFRWELRSHVWFWGTVFLVLALQIPLLLIVRWPHGKGPTLLYTMPIGLADFLATMGAIRLSEKLFSKASLSGDDQEG